MSGCNVTCPSLDKLESFLSEESGDYRAPAVTPDPDVAGIGVRRRDPLHRT